MSNISIKTQKTHSELLSSNHIFQNYNTVVTDTKSTTWYVSYNRTCSPTFFAAFYGINRIMHNVNDD